MNIKQLKTKKQLKEGFEVLKELRPHLNFKKFLEMIKETPNYRLFGIFENKQIVCVAGIGIKTNLYFGKHLWVYDLITKSTERSKGYGKQMMESLEELARKEKCEKIALSSGFQRLDAHKFYESLSMRKTSFVFLKEL